MVQTLKEANEREIYYINIYQSTDERHGYNLAPGGDNKEMSLETRKIISDKAKERYQDSSRNPMYGRKHSEESLKKMSAKKCGKNNPMFGRIWTGIQREKCGTRGKKLKLSDEQRQILSDRMRHIGETVGLKPIKCIEDDIKFKSITEASTYYNVAISTLSGHLKGRQKSCRGKHFEYIDLEGATTIETSVI